MGNWKRLWAKIKAWFRPEPKPPEPPQSDDDLQMDGIQQWLGPNFSGAQIKTGIRTASTDGRMLYTDYEPYNWPTQVVGGQLCDAQCCVFYYRDGRIVGGKFDWWRKGGQGVKTLENLAHGYGGHTRLVRAGYVWTMIASVDGRWRSNIKAVEWK